MILDDRTISSDVGKANAFMSHYASVDSLFQRKRGREIVIENARQCCVDNEAGKNYTITELNLAIAKMKARGAAGPDDILPTFLKALGQVGPCTRSHLLHIFNTSFTEVHLPKCGRMQSVSLYSRWANLLPSSPPSALWVWHHAWWKLRRLYALAKEKGWIRLYYSKAYDKVRWEELLMTMHEVGVPAVFLRLIIGFFLNRQTRVSYNDTLWRPPTMLLLLLLQEWVHRWSLRWCLACW